MKPPKQEIVTFKVDEALHDILKSIPNRSEFIRAAILAALENVCPLCRGTGVLSPNQQKHWEQFARRHPLHQCDGCREYVLECENAPCGEDLRHGAKQG